MQNSTIASGNAAVETYGSFFVAGMELALPVRALQEVVNYPAVVTCMPLAPQHLLGLFNLRGSLIPIVDMRLLLGLVEDVSEETGKVAILELGDTRVGLRFDKTGEIVQARPEQTFGFGSSDAHRSPVICGALKLNDGNRIVQILSASSLLGLPDVPQVPSRVAHARRAARHAQRRKMVSFRVAGVRLALPMTAIQEIIRVPALHPSPLADEICLGMLSLRSHTIPVVDAARFLELARDAAPSLAVETSASDDERRIMILQGEAGHLGLLVDEVCSIVSFSDEDLMPMPAYARGEMALFAGCVGGDEHESLLLLAADALFAHPRIKAVAAGHRDLYDSRSAQTGSSARRHQGGREAYVIFRIGQRFAVRISQLREIIEYPSEIVKTPAAPDLVHGVLNLRRALVTIVDVRPMFGMTPCEEWANTKVLIVEHRDEKYGVVVDAVDDIVTTDTANRIPLPAMLTSQAAAGIRESLKQGIEVPNLGTVMVIDLGLLFEHIAMEAHV